jgi:hypothetical protein
VSEADSFDKMWDKSKNHSKPGGFAERFLPSEDEKEKELEK